MFEEYFYLNTNSVIFHRNNKKKAGMNNRMSKLKYTDVNQKIERVTEILYFIIVKLNIPGCVIPPLIATMVNYYIYKLGDESFYLGAPAM